MEMTHPANQPTHRPRVSIETHDPAPQAPHAEAPEASDAVTAVAGVASGVPEINIPAPELPDVDCDATMARQVYQALRGDPADLPVNSRMLAWMAIQTMWTAGQQQLVQNTRIKRTVETWRTDLKKIEVAANVDRIDGDRRRGRNTLLGSLVATGTTAGMGIFGNTMAMNANGHRIAAGQALVGASQSVGSMLNNMTQSLDKNMGGGRQADDADIRSKTLSRQQDIAQQIADAARSAVESARSEWQKAQQTINDMNDRRAQAISMVHR